MNELRVACEVWSTEVCEVSLTKNLSGKPAKIRLGKVQENLEKDSPWLLVLPWDERLHGIGAQVIMELAHMHEGLIRFPAVAGIVESRPPDVVLYNSFFSTCKPPNSLRILFKSVFPLFSNKRIRIEK